MTALLASALALALVALAVGLSLFGAYAVALWLWSRLPSRLAFGASPAEPARFAALIVAHDEANVVGDSVQSLCRQAYPADRFRVFCVADRCSDRTAVVARGAGATVLERGADGAEGKAAAVAFGVLAVRGQGQGAYDAIAVFDADNVVDPDFLARVSARLGGGDRVVQGFVDAKNPDASWVAGSSALGFWALAAIAQAPRERLGLSTPLMGTGYAMGLDDAVLFLGDARSLTDDLELGARLALAGIRVVHEARARTVDEKPVGLRSAVLQRHRWMQGRWDVAGRYLPRLLARAVTDRISLGERVRLFDVAVQLVAPSLLFTAALLFAIGCLLFGIEFAPGTAPFARAVPPTIWFVIAAVFYAIPAIGIARFRPPSRVWLYYLLQPFYLLWSVPLAISGWFFRRRRRWKRTPKGTA